MSPSSGRGRGGGQHQQSMNHAVFPVSAQVVDMLALHLPPEKLCPQLVSVALSGGCPHPEARQADCKSRCKAFLLSSEEDAVYHPRCPGWKKPCRARTRTSARLASSCWPCYPMELVTTSGRGSYSSTPGPRAALSHTCYSNFMLTLRSTLVLEGN